MKSERFGVRQCVNVVFRAKKSGKLGTMSYVKNQPVLYIDSATTSTLEQAASTSYAQGGRGNSRLIAWEGDKTGGFSDSNKLERGSFLLEFILSITFFIFKIVFISKLKLLLLF